MERVTEEVMAVMAVTVGVAEVVTAHMIRAAISEGGFEILIGVIKHWRNSRRISMWRTSASPLAPTRKSKNSGGISR